LHPRQCGLLAFEFPVAPAAELLLQCPEFAACLIQIGGQPLYLALEEMLIEADHDPMRPPEHLLLGTEDRHTFQPRVG
jgi:hypothetical protein